MEEIKNVFARTKTLQHAYSIEGRWELLRGSLERLLTEDVGVSVTANPDVQCLFFETFGIDESRMLETSAHYKAYAPVGRFFIIGCQSFTHEAQNALLKLLEDPPARTTFFFIVPSHAELLPTLRSRLYLVSKTEMVADDADKETAAAFLNVSLRQRLELVADIIERKDRAEAVRLINGLEIMFFQCSQGENRLGALKQLRMVRRYLLDRAASLKLLLEHLAVTLPTSSA